jgi:arylsulfatase
MCSPSRAAFLTGQPPQVIGVFDPALPNAGSVLKGLGYKTAYFGKFEMDKKILEPKPTVIYSTVAQPYGFDVFGAGGDIGGAPRDGFNNDPFIAGESVRWLRETVKPALQLRPLFCLLQWRRSLARSATIRRHPSSAQCRKTLRSSSAAELGTERALRIG